MSNSPELLSAAITGQGRRPDAAYRSGAQIPHPGP
jgi:hypothetical protein